MLDLLNTFLDFFLKNDYTCAAFYLLFAVLGFYAGYHFAASKNKAKTMPNDSSMDKCELTGKYEFIKFTEPKLFFKPKIIKCSCTFYNKGICAKNNKTCSLISQYSQNYFKQL